MRILITGSSGFVGKNLHAELRARGYEDIILFDRSSSLETLDQACATADFVFHLAGVNRPENDSEYIEGNYNFTQDLIQRLEGHKNYVPVLLSSSIQAELANPYGQSKKMSEDVIFNYSAKHNLPSYVFRLPNLYGKWSQPNYNSVVATWCYSIARDLPIEISNPDYTLKLAYIDDVVQAFMDALKGNSLEETHYHTIEPLHEITLGGLATRLRSFRELRETRQLPDFSNLLTKNLYSTYLSYLPEDKFSYPLLTHADHRGSFTEFIRTVGGGQVSINVSKPGVSKGDHWHHTKNEKFLVVSGEGKIRFRGIFSNDIITYEVSSNKLEVVDIPVGYTHDIINTGTTDLVTVMWVNENFDPENPDTYPLEVEQ